MNGSSVVDVDSASAYGLVGGQVPADYISGSGVADILPQMGLSSIMLPIYAVIDLEMATLVYYQDGNGSGVTGALTSIQQANQ